MNDKDNNQTQKEVERDNYYMKQQQSALDVLKLIFIGAAIATCLLIGFRIIKIF